MEELKQCGRGLSFVSFISLRIDWVPVKKKERSRDVFEHVVGMFEEGGARNIDGYIDRAHQICKTYCDKKSWKKYEYYC